MEGGAPKWIFAPGPQISLNVTSSERLESIWLADEFNVGKMELKKADKLFTGQMDMQKNPKF